MYAYYANDMYITMQTQMLQSQKINKLLLVFPFFLVLKQITFFFRISFGDKMSLIISVG